MSRRSDSQALVQRVESLRERGSGYVEVSRPDRPFPWLALSFTGDKGVVHQFTSTDECLLLKGDGSLSSERHVEVPVHEERHPFAGNDANVDRALDVVMRFAAGTEPAELGDWDVL